MAIEHGLVRRVADTTPPGYSTDRSPYILSSADHHSNALANRLLAQYVLNKILR